jgi:hypothetical protein
MSVRDRLVGAEAGADLGNRLAAFEVLVATHRLQLLDELWTSYLELADPEDRAALDRDLPELRRLVDDMVSELRELPDRARRLRGLMEDLGADVVEQTLAAVLAEHPLADQTEDVFRGGLDDYDFRGAVIIACDYLQESSEEAARDLQDKLQSIADGSFEHGDFKLPFRCALFLAGAGASVAGAVATAIVTGDVSQLPEWAGVTMTALIAWVKAGCPGSMREISFGRRG